VHLHAIGLRGDDDDKDYFPEAMSDIYDTAVNKKAAGKGNFILIHRRPSTNIMYQAKPCD
jgi:hypothetical protein